MISNQIASKMPSGVALWFNEVLSLNTMWWPESTERTTKTMQTRRLSIGRLLPSGQHWTIHPFYVNIARETGNKITMVALRINGRPEVAITDRWMSAHGISVEDIDYVATIFRTVWMVEILWSDMVKHRPHRHMIEYLGLPARQVAASARWQYSSFKCNLWTIKDDAHEKRIKWFQIITKAHVQYLGIANHSSHNGGLDLTNGNTPAEKGAREQKVQLIKKIWIQDYVHTGINLLFTDVAGTDGLRTLLISWMDLPSPSPLLMKITGERFLQSVNLDNHRRRQWLAVAVMTMPIELIGRMLS